MKTASVSTIKLQIAIFAIACSLLCVSISHAQTSANANSNTNSNSELRATIFSQLLQDPRTQSLTPVQLNAMVDQLTAEAEKQHVSAQQITWHPRSDEAASTATEKEECSNKYLCMFNDAFGFSTADDLSSAVVIGGLALILIILIYLIRRHHHQHGWHQ